MSERHVRPARGNRVVVVATDSYIINMVSIEGVGAMSATIHGPCNGTPTKTFTLGGTVNLKMRRFWVGSGTTWRLNVAHPGNDPGLWLRA